MHDKSLEIDQVITPEEVARRIAKTSGVAMTARTVWDKALRLGVAKKLGRSRLILVSDIPELLQIEPPRDRGSPRIRNGADALKLLKASRETRRREEDNEGAIALAAARARLRELRNSRK